MLFYTNSEIDTQTEGRIFFSHFSQFCERALKPNIWCSRGKKF